MLKRAEIRGFKSLRGVSVELGAFNVLIGPNDSGKSSFLQALSWASRFFRGDHSGPSRATAASVRLTSAKSQLKISQITGSPTAIEIDGSHLFVPSSPAGARFASISEPAREFLHVSEPIMLEATEIASASPKGSGSLNALIQNRGRGATAHLARCALGDRVRYERIQHGMREITGGRVAELIVGEDPGSGYPLSVRLYDDAILPAKEISQGLLLYFAFLTIVHRDDAPAVLLIEEPENGVHPLRLYEIIKLLRTLTERGVQVVLTTHSPDLVNACKPEEVLVFRRPALDSGTEISRLPADFERRAMRSSMGEIWASTGEEGLLDILPEVAPRVSTESD